MWKRRDSYLGGSTKFFYVGLSHDSLANLYHVNFALMQHHKYSLTELENMIPFERDIYLNMLIQWLDKEKERIEKGKNG